MRRVALTVAAVAVTALAVWGVLHVVITPVNPAQEPPQEHVSGPCWACHLVLSSADLIEP